MEQIRADNVLNTSPVIMTDSTASYSVEIKFNNKFGLFFGFFVLKVTDNNTGNSAAGTVFMPIGSQSITVNEVTTKMVPLIEEIIIINKLLGGQKQS